MKAKHDEAQVEKDQKAARDEEKKQKNALYVATVVTQGARVLQSHELVVRKGTALKAHDP
jgi:hypothetical protein